MRRRGGLFISILLRWSINSLLKERSIHAHIYCRGLLITIFSKHKIQNQMKNVWNIFICQLWIMKDEYFLQILRQNVPLLVKLSLAIMVSPGHNWEKQLVGLLGQGDYILSFSLSLSVSLSLYQSLCILFISLLCLSLSFSAYYLSFLFTSRFLSFFLILSFPYLALYLLIKSSLAIMVSPNHNWEKQFVGLLGQGD